MRLYETFARYKIFHGYITEIHDAACITKNRVATESSESNCNLSEVMLPKQRHRLGHPKKRLSLSL